MNTFNANFGVILHIAARGQCTIKPTDAHFVIHAAPRSPSIAHAPQVVLLAVVAFLACAAGSEVSTGTEEVITAVQDYTPTDRLLRADTKGTVDDEERAAIKAPESLTSFFKSIKSSTASKIAYMSASGDKLLDMMQLKRVTTDKAFVKLKLNRDLDGLLTNPNLKEFAKYLERLNDPKTKVGLPTAPIADTMIATIVKSYKNDKEVAKTLVRAKENEKTKALATDLEQALFKKRMNGRPPMHKDDVSELIRVRDAFLPWLPKLCQG
ncbi:hypothetical protein PHYSODRAFT_285676 [Phytophthora sojae]|uniref:RxLR effector protein n=1 Tax=Phytophthora sojae (strain P6497) TaxID=1094619 RepID=G4Z8H7_PHYSP|nr:hypothetical protein PHYSODRAFT_285676 [Phytophthora sojae]EGZ21897.1 hypothetical protein PHYSODRAFT_285676 [Phytophthora sojae]|eukprot:XP_009524614.1 hypothetical protein PHYSODRAFT_285676 [Phytophthora sojae]